VICRFNLYTRRRTGAAEFNAQKALPAEAERIKRTLREAASPELVELAEEHDGRPPATWLAEGREEARSKSRLKKKAWSRRRRRSR